MAVRADCGVRGLPMVLKEALSRDVGGAVLTIRAQRESFQVEGRGSSALTFQNQAEIVVRKSGFISDRTLLINADRAAKDVPRSLVRILQNPEQLVVIEIRAV